jgi:SNF2 family DNA or RNA helicase
MTDYMNMRLATPRVGINYLEHQVTGIRWMLEREAMDAPYCRGGILADDMGLGKTFQTIGLLKNSPMAGMPTLIICPPALLSGWAEELKACGYVPRQLLKTAAWSPVPAGSDAAASVWLTTYPRATLYHAFLTGGPDKKKGDPWGRVVLDEGHVIRNGKDTSRWVHCMAIAARATCRWILSATPVQNSYGDWKNLCAWLRVTCDASELMEVGQCIMLRRTMSELRETMAALPPTPRFIVRDLEIPATGGTIKEGRLFRSLCDQLDSIMDSRAVSALMKLELYMRIQQFLVHPQIYVEGMRKKFKSAYPRPDWNGTATKWAACLEELSIGVRQEKSQIVFCNFRAEMDMVCAAATGLGADVFSIRGGMGSEAVGDAVTMARAAATSGKPVVVVVQIVSGGAGLNLQFCSRILFLSQHWNPAVVHQAVGRAVRIGQRSVVEIFMFRIVDAVLDNLDRRMIEVHLRKIAGAREICETLYEGYAPLSEIPYEDEEGPTMPAEDSSEDPTGVVVEA